MLAASKSVETRRPTEPSCIEPDQMPYPGVKALEEDCQAIADYWNQKDDERGVKEFSFGQKGAHTQGTVDYLLPAHHVHGTCRVGISIEPPAFDRIGYAFFFEFALATKWIFSFCSTRGGRGGGVPVGDGLAMALYGIPRYGTEKESDGNVTEEFYLDACVTSIMGDLRAEGISGSTAVTQKV